MDEVARTLRLLGGTATWGELRRDHRRSAIDRAIGAGAIARVARGTYVLPDVHEHLREARRLCGVVSHLSAALQHGWKVAVVPADASVTVRRKRHLPASARGSTHVHWSDLAPHEVVDGATSEIRTVLDCSRTLPFPEALAVADSALRSGTVTRDEIRAAVSRASGPGSRNARRVVEHADGRAANPFESVLRALCIEEGFDLTPQLVITDNGLWARVDLGCEVLRLAVEAEGFEHHGTRVGLRKDCRRHTELAVFGWSSLRFSYEDVMGDPEWTRWALRSWRTVRAGGLPSAPPVRQPTVTPAA